MDYFFLPLQVFFQRFWLEPFWFALLILTLLLLALLILLPGLLDALRTRKRLRIFKRIADDTMHDIFVPDGLGGDVYISHLLLMSDQIAILNEKPFAGKIFGDANVDQWTQTVRQRSFRFANPLVELQSQTIAINKLLGQCCAKGYLVFSDDSEFPWGKPENVYLRNELTKIFAPQEHAADSRQPIHEAVKQAWSKLQQLAISSKPEISRYRSYLIVSILIVAAFSLSGWAWYEQAPAWIQSRAILLD
ncbi:MAG: NERD domain-containing protein [Gammaproteobacteria bacterium]|nr:NERD domain-containing protein [Gammaproteobacteria bacterium]